jgi:hypothetical protein
MPAAARQLILAAATGYRWEQLQPFVESLRRTGFSGEVLMLVGALAPEDARQLRAAGVRTRRVQPLLGALPNGWRRKLYSHRLRWIHRAYPGACDALPASRAQKRRAAAWCGRLFHHIACSRYFYYLSYLQAHAGDYDRVMLTDVRDVLFQADPFGWKSPAQLQFFLEHREVTIGTQPGNALWVRNAYSEAELQRIAHQRVSCSGITFGSTKGMLDYLAAMTDELTRATPRIAGFDGYDQGVHNHLVWSGAFPAAELLENGRGPVLTMHGMPESEFRRNAHGDLVDDRGGVVPVLHQYDRHPALRDALLARFATPRAAAA